MPQEPQKSKAPVTRPPSMEERAKRVLQVFAEWFREAFAKLRDVSGTNYRLGQYHFEKGNFEDAALRFRMVTWMKPDHRDGWLWLAKSRMAQEDAPKAKAALKKLLKLEPQHEEGRRLLHTLLHPPAPKPADSPQEPQ